MLQRIGCIVTFFASLNAFAMTPLYEAVGDEDLSRVQALIVEGADVNAQDHVGWTPLHQAVNNGNLGVMQALIVAGADVRVQSHAGGTPLHYAAMGGRLSVVQLLIAAGADVNVVDHKVMRTPLHYAVIEGYEGYLENVKALIAAGANVDAKDIWGKTPLMEAELSRRHDIVAYINEYKQRVAVAQARAPRIRRTLAMANHVRLGAKSPLAGLPHILCDIANFTISAELHDAAQPKKQQRNLGCIIC